MYSAREVFGDDLLRDEEVLWYGQPHQSGRFTRADVFLIPFGIFWTLFTIFWLAMLLAIAIAEDPAAFAGLTVGIPFLLIGLYMLFGRFWYKRWIKKRTHYAVTDRRVLSLTDAFGRHVYAAYIDRIPSMKTSAGKDGIGTIWFGNTPWWVSFYGNTGLEFFGWMYGEPPVVFYDIREVAEVSGLVNELRNR